MNVLEKEIEDVLFQSLPNRAVLKERGFIHFENKYYRQMYLGSYGQADIVGASIHKGDKERQIDITIYELKKDEINMATLMQAMRYVRGIQTYFEKIFSEYIPIQKYKIVCIGKTIDMTTEFIFSPNIFDNVFLYTYGIDLIKGITFTPIKNYKVLDPDPLYLPKFISRESYRTLTGSQE
jgi:hypothetical protein